MFEFICIFTNGGVMLWSKTFIESVIRYDILNSFIKDIIIEEKKGLEQYVKQGFII